MAEEFGDPVAAEEGKSKSSVILIVVVILIILCCCCISLIPAFFYGTEPVMDLLGIPIPW